MKKAPPIKKAGQEGAKTSKRNYAQPFKPSQCDRLLDALIAAKPNGISTVYAINRLNILCPASRANELRKRGHEIEVTRVNAATSNGHEFKRVAYYTLLSGGEE